MNDSAKTTRFVAQPYLTGLPLVVMVCVVAALAVVRSVAISAETGRPEDEGQYEVRLRSHTFTPTPGVEARVRDTIKRALDRGQSQHVYVQFVRLPHPLQKELLELAGLELQQFVGSLTWHAVVTNPDVLEKVASEPEDNQFGIRSIAPIDPAHKESPYLRVDWGKGSRLDDGRRQLIVHFFKDVSEEEAGKLCDDINVETLHEVPGTNQLIVAVADHRITDISELDAVSWIEPVPPPGRPESDRVRDFIHVEAAQTAGYDGSDVDVGVFEAGHVMETHPDLAGRVTKGDGDPWDRQQHPTMTGGFIAGDGSRSTSAVGGGTAFQYRGMAPASKLITYDFWVGEAATWADAYSNYLGDLLDAINTRHIDIGNNSWGTTGGCGVIAYGDYTELCDDLDAAVAGGYEYESPLIIVFSAGNERAGFADYSVDPPVINTTCLADANFPYRNYDTLNHPKSAKNVIVVGAVDSHNNRMSSYSSWGPTDDGRIKPDVVAAGHHDGTVQSDVTEITNPYGTPIGGPNQQDYRSANDDHTGTYIYAWYSQTSAAAAATTGGIAQLLQAHREKLSTELDPLPSTVRAMLVQTARDLDDTTDWYNPGPDYASGFGVVQIHEAIELIGRGYIIEDKVDVGRADRYTIDVPAGTPRLKFTLAWDDPAPAPGAANILVNDLDLEVRDPHGNLYYPWTLDPSNPDDDAVRTRADHTNNLEQVVVDASVAPGGTLPDGIWEIRIEPYSVPEGPQRYSIVASERLLGAVDVMLVLDRSGSMDGMASPGMPDSKIETLRSAATQLVDVMLVDRGYQLGLVQFNEDVVLFPPAAEANLDLHTTRRADHLKMFTIPSIFAGGWTSIGDGLREAHNQLTASPSPADVERVILLVTDGKENRSEWISDVRTDLISDDVTVYVLGLGYGTGVDELKLVNLAADTAGTYRITADHLAFQKLFIETLSGVVDWSLVTDPAGELTREHETTVPFTIAGDETHATIVTAWQGPKGAIDLSLITPSGRLITKSTTNRQIRYVEHAQHVLFRLDFPLSGVMAHDWDGEWRARISPSPKLDQGQLLRHATSVFAEGGVKIEVNAAPVSGFAGDPIILVARLTRSRAPVPGAEVQVAADVPSAWIGDLLAEQTGVVGRKFFHGDPVSLVDQKLAMLTRDGEKLLGRQTKTFRLFDDGEHKDGKAGDGVYGNVFATTKVPGSYNFRVLASKIPAGRVQSTRESSLSVYCGVRPDPRRSEIRVARTGDASYEVRVTPRDARGVVMGPGHTVQAVVTATDRQLPFAVTDLLDGSYAGNFSWPRDLKNSKAHIAIRIDFRDFTEVTIPGRRPSVRGQRR